jgi:NAD(P)-dependent dehydrogenase (short-subunit alcohol dehydrogenase family)
MATVLVIGASRGIGLEFVRQYAAEGARVIGTVRRTEDAARLRDIGARPLLLDVVDEATVAEFGVQLHGEKLDVAIYNAGVYGPRTSAIAAPGGLDFDSVMHTNVRAPMQLIPQLVPGLAATGGKFALVSSRMGSISLMSSTSGWLYRTSKAAANAALRAAAIELGTQGIVCIAFHPGWVRTDMGGAGADIDAATSVAGMRRVLATANASQNGKFLNFNGEQLAW